MFSKKLASLFALLGVAVTAGAIEPAGGRIQSMGGAGVALPEEAATIYWNPAGIYFQNRLATETTLIFSALDWPGNWGMSYVNYSAKQRRGAGLGIYRTSVEAVDDSADAGNGIAALLATVYPTPIGIPVGLSFKYINESWQGSDRKSLFSMDVGVGLQLSSFYLGFAMQNATRPQSHIYLRQGLLGASWKWQDWIEIAAQVGADNWDAVEDLGKADAALGISIAPSNRLALHLGRRDILGTKLWTGGFTFSNPENTGKIHLGYQHYPDGQADDRVIIGLEYSP